MRTFLSIYALGFVVMFFCSHTTNQEASLFAWILAGLSWPIGLGIQLGILINDTRK